MKTILAIVTAAALGSSLAFAQDKDKKPSDKQLAQQQRMKDCNAQAGKKDMKGDERKAFMSKCLAGKEGENRPSGKQAAQQDKMKSCNAQASKKALKGDERKAFMSKCLSA